MRGLLSQFMRNNSVYLLVVKAQKLFMTYGA